MPADDPACLRAGPLLWRHWIWRKKEKRIKKEWERQEMGKKRRTEKKTHLFDWLNVLGVLEPRWMRIIIPITVPNQKNTGNKNVVVVVMRRHSLRLLAGWYRRFGYNFPFPIYLCWRLCRPIYFGFPLRTVIMINFNRTSRGESRKQRSLELPIVGTGSHERSCSEIFFR